MTMIEMMVVTAVFSIAIVTTYAAVQNMRSYTSLNETEVELQEEARQALQDMGEQLRNAARCNVPAGNAPVGNYPKIYKSQGTSQCLSNYKPSAKNAPKARAGTYVCGGDPTLDSDQMAFVMPKLDATSMPVYNGDDTIAWSAQEYGIFICPAADGSNQIEFRDSIACQGQINAGVKVCGNILCRYVDRMQIQDCTTDPTLTSRQLRLTLYLTRIVNRSQLTIGLSGIVDLRNTSQMQ